MRLARCHRCVIADLRSLVRHSRCARRGGLWRGCWAIMAAIAPAAPVTMPAYSPATTAVTAVAPAARATTAAVPRLGGTGRPIQECKADDPKKHGNGKDQLSIHRSILSSSCERPIQFSYGSIAAGPAHEGHGCRLNFAAGLADYAWTFGELFGEDCG